jgi:hypothetical protein
VHFHSRTTMLLQAFLAVVFTASVSVEADTNSTGIRLRNGFERVYIQVRKRCLVWCSAHDVVVSSRTESMVLGYELVS